MLWIVSVILPQEKNAQVQTALMHTSIEIPSQSFPFAVLVVTEQYMKRSHMWLPVSPCK